MKMNFVVTLLLLGISSSGHIAYCQSAQTKGGQADMLDDRAIVGPRAIGMPSGVFLLVRKGKEIGAVRFLKIERGKGSLIGKAFYESFFQGDGSTSFIGVNVVKRSGEVTTKTLMGIGRMSFGGGQRKLQIGKWSFAYRFPAWVTMYPYGEVEGDHGFEFAPTSARELAEIDATDKRLKWFRYDPNASTTLLLSDLAK